MKVLGFRADSKCPRYAILEKDNSGNIVFLNKNGEHRLPFPAAETSEEAKLRWLYDEFKRILSDKYIKKIIIKENEYSRGAKGKAQREVSEQEGILKLLCAQKAIPIATKLYTALGVNSGSVEQKAEALAGKTNLAWNKKIADAVVAAYSLLGVR